MAATTVSLREANVADASTLAHLHRRTALRAFADIFPPEAPTPNLDALVADWTRRIGANDAERRVCFVAETHASAVGVIVAGADPQDDSRGHLSRLYVDPTHWGHGIGTLLYERAITHLREQCFASATLWVLEGNVHARTWYERRGWNLNGDRTATYAPAGIDDVGYQLPL